MRKHQRLTTAALLTLLIGGLSLLLYPHVAQRWNQMHQSRVIAAYAQQLTQLDRADFSHHWEAALAYNRQLSASAGAAGHTPPQKEQYHALLDPTGSGVMGYLEIPAIDCRLPICHGSDEATLRSAVGHVEWSSLPVGGEGSHCVLSGHCGMAGARLFTDLDELVIGDIFTLQVLDETLTYQVDQILTVLPHETQALQIQPDEDYCTLVTCTPYAINTHRLLVRGCRVETEVPADAVQTPPGTQGEPDGTKDGLPDPPSALQEPVGGLSPSLALAIVFCLPFFLLPLLRQRSKTAGNEAQ